MGSHTTTLHWRHHDAFDATLPRSRRWIPGTKLGRLVKEGRIRSLEESFLHSMPIKEHQIVDHFFPPVRSQCL